jgi:ribonuclease HI
MKNVRIYIDAYIDKDDINRTGGWAALIECDNGTKELIDAQSGASESRLALTAIASALYAIREPSNVLLTVSCDDISRYFALAEAHRNRPPFRCITSRRDLDVWAKIVRLMDIHNVNCLLRCKGAHEKTKERAILAAHTKRTVYETQALFAIN